MVYKDPRIRRLNDLAQAKVDENLSSAAIHSFEEALTLVHPRLQPPVYLSISAPPHTPDYLLVSAWHAAQPAYTKTTEINSAIDIINNFFAAPDNAVPVLSQLITQHPVHVEKLKKTTRLMTAIGKALGMKASDLGNPA